MTLGEASVAMNLSPKGFAGSSRKRSRCVAAGGFKTPAPGKGDEAMEPDQTLKRTEDLGLLAVVRGESRRAAVEVSEALVEGGVLGIEITFTTPEAAQAIRDLDEEYGDRILLGAGTVTIHEQVDQAAEAGANFLVSPGCDPNLMPAMLETGLLVLPGTLTPSEVMLAQRLSLSGEHSRLV